MFDALVIAQETAQEVDVNLTLPGLLALVAGIAILVFPRLLNYIVAAYLIFVGVVEVFDITV